MCNIRPEGLRGLPVIGNVANRASR